MDSINSDRSYVSVSVIMPVHNGGKFLSDAIESILLQSFTNFEFIIINDGSTDGSEVIIKSFIDKRIKYIDNITNKGLVYSLNKGLSQSKGKYIARMDADDISINNRLEKQFNFLEKNKEVSVLATTVKLINESNEEIGYWKKEKNKISKKDILDYLPIDNCIAHPSIMAKSNCLKLYGYKQEQELSEDYDLWLRLAADGIKIEKLNEDLLLHRIVASSFTRARQQNNFNKLWKLKKKFIANQINEKKINWFVIRTGLYCLTDYFKANFKEIKKKLTK